MKGNKPYQVNDGKPTLTVFLVFATLLTEIQASCSQCISGCQIMIYQPT